MNAAQKPLADYDAGVDRITERQQDIAFNEPGVEGGSGDGVQLVGREIAPGLYTIKGNGTCYWARLRGLSGEVAGFTSVGCGPWMLLPE